MADHSELIAEIASVEKMNTPERLKHAKKRRSQQLKRFANYEKQLEKKKNKMSQNQKRNQRNRRGVRFIHNIMLLEAAARNDIEEVRLLLRRNVNPDVTNEDGLTALHQCCIDDSEEMLKLLLEYGANVNARDSEMWTPLHAAATCGHVHLCKLLIDKNADLLAVNADGNMPYDICEDDVALDYIETEMAKRGITQEEIDDKRLETEKQMLEDLKALAKEGRSLEYREKKSRATPLHIAAANGYLDVVEFLLDQHVAMDPRDEDGWLPIHAAACWLQPEVIEALVKNGADLDAKTRNGETPFDLAEDPDVKQKILDLKDELETHRASRSKDHVRNRRTNTRGASIRRTSMRGEKRPLFKKEAKEEALHFGYGSRDDDDTAEFMDDDKENLPATNIDDVKLSFVEEDEADRGKHVNSFTESVKKPKVASADNKGRNSGEIRDSPRSKDTGINGTSSAKSSTGDSQKVRRAEPETRKQEPARNSVEREPIHIHMKNSQDSGPVRESRSQAEREGKDSSNKVPPTVQNPQKRQVQAQSGVNRAPSFTKKRDSQRRAREQDSPEKSDSGQVRYPTGPQSGTLSDLKKQRAEQHKFGNSLDAQVANLFLHSLSTDSKKYSSSGGGGVGSGSPQPPTNKESTRNGRNNNNNNNVPGQSHPQTYISDNGTLRRFSGPTSAPVIGDDDKFKSNCCVVM